MTHKWVQNEARRSHESTGFLHIQDRPTTTARQPVSPGTTTPVEPPSSRPAPREEHPRGQTQMAQPRPRPDDEPGGLVGPTSKGATMARAKHPCAEPACPTPVPAGTSRCPQHTRAQDKARGSRQARGYDRDYDRTRRKWAPLVATGQVACHRCHHPITPGTPWDLGHHDHDRTIITGPEHAYTCNRAAAGRASHGLPTP